MTQLGRAWLDLVALALIWLGTLVVTFVGIPALVPGILMDGSGNVLMDRMARTADCGRSICGC